MKPLAEAGITTATINFDLGAAWTEATRTFALTPKEAAIYELLSRSPLHIDDIISQTELTAGEVSSMLLHLELKGAVLPLPGTHYAVT